MTDTELIKQLVREMGNLKGQIIGMQHAIQVLIAMAPDKDAAIRAISAELERGSTLASAMPIDDDYIAGIAHAKDKVLPSPRILALFEK